jgi:hypothetical protein
MRFLILLLTALEVSFVVPTTPSYAIPAFARKYKTSCATCHTGFPKLNAFGEAYRRNGYQFPGGTDREFTKEEPVSMGSKGNKEAFPDAIWPGSIPGTSPISLMMNGEIDYNPRFDADNPASVSRFTFGGLGSSIEAIAAGTLGEDLSFWGHAILNSDGSLELNRIFLIFSNILGSDFLFNARVGVFEPDLFSFSTHRAWFEGYWITMRPFSEDMGFTFEEIQKGLEVRGIVRKRFAYAAGIVEGFGPPHSNKDYYGHITYKFGGMPLDGVVEEKSSAGPSRPYFDNSMTVGLFAYRGSSVIGPDSAYQSNDFTEVGGDANVYYGPCNLFGGVGIRHDDRPFVGSLGSSANTADWFGELDVVVFPWLLPGIRYESWKSHMRDPATGRLVAFTDNQIVPGIETLLRANLKATIRTVISKLESKGETKHRLGQVALILSLGI